MAEQWRTRAEINAARDRFEQAIPGWQRPAAWGFGPVGDDGLPVFRRVNVGDGFLPAVVLGSVCGHVAGSRSYTLGVNDLDRVIARLAPALACTEMPHPNTVAMRALRAELGDDDLTVVVFLDEIGDETSDDPHVRVLRESLG